MKLDITTAKRVTDINSVVNITGYETDADDMAIAIWLFPCGCWFLQYETPKKVEGKVTPGEYFVMIGNHGWFEETPEKAAERLQLWHDGNHEESGRRCNMCGAATTQDWDSNYCASCERELAEEVKANERLPDKLSEVVRDHDYRPDLDEIECRECGEKKMQYQISHFENKAGVIVEICEDCVRDCEQETSLCLDSDVLDDATFDQLYQWCSEYLTDPKGLVDTWAKKNGFEREETGGGCTALTKTWKDKLNGKEMQVVVTVYGEPSIPTTMTEEVIVGWYLLDDCHSEPVIQFVVNGLENIRDDQY